MTINFYKRFPLKKLTKALFASLACLLFFPNVLYAEKSYIKCWKNADGLTECGNRIPREYYNQRIRYIDDAGITRKVKKRAKTREELDTQNELDNLLALQKKQQKKTKNYDSVLLKTYLTIDDLLNSLNSKLTLIESQALILESTISLKKREFGSLVRKAANMERSGKPISAQLVIQLDSARNDLKSLQVQASSNQLEAEKIKATFAHDVERFILSKSNRIQYNLATPRQAQKLHALRLTCLNQSQCDLHWGKANDFIKKYATTKILYQTDKISVTDIPETHNDISMSLSLITIKKTKPEKYIIFQIRCNREREGQEFCSGEEINSLLKEFKSIVYQ